MEIFRSLCQNLGCLGRTGTDLVKVSSIAYQTTATTFHEKHVKLRNEVVQLAQGHADSRLTMNPLQDRSLTVVVFSDAFFVNNADSYTQTGFAIFLRDQTTFANCMHFASHKVKRVVQSVPSGNLCALTDAYGYAFLLRDNMASVFSTWFPLVLLTDSIYLYNLLIHTSKVSTENDLG